MEVKRHDKSFMASKLFKFRKDSIGRDKGNCIYIYVEKQLNADRKRGMQRQSQGVLISAGSWQEALRASDRNWKYLIAQRKTEHRGETV